MSSHHLMKILKYSLRLRELSPYCRLFQDTGWKKNNSLCWQRVLRGLIHGSISQEDAGIFLRHTVSVDESYQIAIRCSISGLHTEREKMKSAG